MMWMYAVRGKELYATDLTSLSELNDFSSTVDWLWVDIFNPDEKEREIISELLGNEPAIVEGIRRGTYNPPGVYTRYERLHDYALLSIPSVDLDEQLRIYPIFIVVKNKNLITWGEEQEHSHSRIIKSTTRRFREYVEEGGKATSSLVISMLFREVASKNSEAILSLRDSIDHIEEKNLHGRKQAIHSVFSLKKKVSTLYRLLMSERELMLDVKERVIPRVELDEKTESIVDDTIEALSRELELLTSCDRALDTILTLQDLASIHRVESSINYLTIILVIGTAILIVLEVMAKSGGH
ncbi:MAG: CorA family divalent cation transporter [Candidatus Bathyarchaeia archaeon]